MEFESSMVSKHDVAHVLVPQKYRFCLKISLPCTLTSNVIQDSLLTSQPDALSIILSVDESVSESEYTYHVQTIMVPNEVKTKLITHGFSSAIFYVGPSKDPRKVQVLDGPPTMEMVKTIDDNGNEREYMSGLVVL